MVVSMAARKCQTSNRGHCQQDRPGGKERMSIVYSIQSGENFKKVFTGIKINDFDRLTGMKGIVERVSE